MLIQSNSGSIFMGLKLHTWNHLPCQENIISAIAISGEKTYLSVVAYVLVLISYAFHPIKENAVQPSWLLPSSNMNIIFIMWTTLQNRGWCRVNGSTLHCNKIHFRKPFMCESVLLFKTNYELAGLNSFFGYYLILVLSNFQQSFSHKATVSGCDRELNAHF